MLESAIVADVRGPAMTPTPPGECELTACGITQAAHGIAVALAWPRTYGSHTLDRIPRNTSQLSTARRIPSLDIIRGAAMVLMALDHVRVFAAVPAGGPTPGVFFTRWITSYCAPAFVFLAGTGAYLHGQRTNRSGLSTYLLARGALLILLELTVSRLGWTFNFDYAHYTEGNVLWMIGWCMIALAGLSRLPLTAVGTFGIAVVAGHNLVATLVQSTWPRLDETTFAWLWQLLYFGGDVVVGPNGPRLVILYSIIPWVGVIAAGYAFGPVIGLESRRRRRICVALGVGAVAVFLALRVFDGYGDPYPWRQLRANFPAPLAFLLTNKYPASLLFLLMTLGPTIGVLPLLERARGRIAAWLATFGRVPLFFYLLHIPFVHAVAVLMSHVRSPGATGWLFLNHPLRVPPAPPGYRWSLLMLYIVWLAVVVILYFPSRWFADLQARRPDSWLAYL